MFCANCGTQIDEGIKFCSGCGKPINNAPGVSAAPVAQQQTAAGQTQSTTAYPPGYVPKDWTVALLLLIFLGGVGAHRFYVGKIGTGILTLLITLFTFGIGWIVWFIIDLVSICTNKFTDKQGYLLKKN